jgi:hypothetical protein
MNIFKSIQLRNSGEICQKCAHFQNDPELIEKMYPGLTTMSSGFASVRDKDGICSFNQLYLSARDSCPHFVSLTADVRQVKAEILTHNKK